MTTQPLLRELIEASYRHGLGTYDATTATPDYDARMSPEPRAKGNPMRDLIYTAFMSIDGVVEAPGGEPGYRNAGWTFKGIEFLPEAYELKGREQYEAGAMMLGRVSYQAFSSVWPSMDEFAAYNAMPKYVVSTTLADNDLVDNWGEITILRSTDEVVRVKTETEGDPIIIHGSATLARSLGDAGLIDRYHLLVFPVVLGAGKRMWSETDKDKQPLRLVESESYPNGIQKLVYELVR